VTKTEINFRRVPGLILASMLAAGLVLALPAQAQSESGISTTQTADPNPATVGQPLTFTVTVTNDAAPQHVGLKDFFPEGAELVSTTPSQGNCGSGHHSNAVQCVLGDLPSGGSATVEVVVLPTVPGTAKNTAVGGGEHSPEISDEATVDVNLAP
jgi:uncharacterized repeat protein (TIGR01451 family)